MQLGCTSVAFIHSFVRAFIQRDLVTKISHEWLEQSQRNLREILTSPY